MQVCPICSQNAELSHKYDAIGSIFEEKKILKCKHCEYHFCSEIGVDILNTYYESNYDQNDYSRSKEFPLPKEYFKQRSNQFKPDRSDVHVRSAKKHLGNHSPVSILDCGAGLGTTLNIAKNTFPNAELHAFENDLLAKQYLKYIGVNQHSGSLLDFLNQNDLRFDFIICSHFLEHVAPSAIHELTELLIKSLSDQGILLIEVPNDNWFRYPHKIHNLPPHVSFFSIKSLKHAFINLKIVSIGTIWGTSRKHVNIFSSFFDLVWRNLSKIIYKIPYVSHGDAILIILKKKLS